MNYCDMSPDKLLSELETDFDVGLTSEQAEQRLKKDGRQISVCEDAPGHFEYWQKLVNANPDDCCNLRK